MNFPDDSNMSTEDKYAFARSVLHEYDMALKRGSIVQKKRAGFYKALLGWGIATVVQIPLILLILKNNELLVAIWLTFYSVLSLLFLAYKYFQGRVR